MELSVSNLAWQPQNDPNVGIWLQQAGIYTIDIAPGKYFRHIPPNDPQEVPQCRQAWQQRGIRMIGMQSLLYHQPQLNLFGDLAMQAQILTHLKHLCLLAHGLGIDRLTLGSPKQRDKGERTYTQAFAQATPLLRALGDIAAKHHTRLCIEANPALYGCNFITHTEQAAAWVEEINHPAIALQLDTGTMLINQEQPEQLIPTISHLIGHIHISAPHLEPPDFSDPFHARCAEQIHTHLSQPLCTLEMLAPKPTQHPSLHAILFHFRQCYGNLTKPSPHTDRSAEMPAG